MQSANATINQMHAAYLSITGQDEVDLPTQFYERQWYDAIKLGLTIDDLRIGLRYRMRAKKTGSQWVSTKLRHIIGDESYVLSFREDIAEEKARMRRVNGANKAAVLAMTGRPEQPEQKPRHISEVIRAIA